MPLRIGEGSDPIVFALQLGRLADAGLAQQGEGPIVLEVGQRPQFVPTEIVPNGITQKACVGQVKLAGLRNPEALPVVTDGLAFADSGR